MNREKSTTPMEGVVLFSKSMIKYCQATENCVNNCSNWGCFDMKSMKCELCGSSDLIKKDGFFECQYCKTKYTTEEAKKLLVEITGEVTVSNMGDKDSYMKLAQNANESQNYKETENYCNKVLEIDINNYEAWLMKGRSVGWQSTIANTRTLESVKCFENAINNAPDEKKEEVTNQAVTEMKRLLESLGNLAASFYQDHPTENNAKTVIDTFPKIIRDIETFTSFVSVDFTDVITKIGISFDKVAMNAYHRDILPDYKKSDPTITIQPVNEFLSLSMCSILLIDLAIACLDENKEKPISMIIQMYKNKLEILQERDKAYTIIKLQYFGHNASAKDKALVKDLKKENEDKMTEVKQKIKELENGKARDKSTNQKNAGKGGFGWWVFCVWFGIGALGGLSFNPKLAVSFRFNVSNLLPTFK